MSRFSIGLILLFTATAIVFFLIAPEWSSIGATRAEIDRLRTLNDELTSLAQERDRLTKEYNAISEADLVKLRSIAPQGQSTASALVDLEALTNKDGMFLSRVDFGGAPSSSGGLASSQASTLLSPLPVALSLRGTYSALRSFLQDAEHMLRLFDIGDIAFGGIQTANDQLQITLKGKMYYRP